MKPNELDSTVTLNNFEPISERITDSEQSMQSSSLLMMNKLEKAEKVRRRWVAKMQHASSSMDKASGRNSTIKERQSKNHSKETKTKQRIKEKSNQKMDSVATPPSE